jgi:transposase InsO family protein
MSKPGKPYDNAIMEPFNMSLKTEMLDNKNGYHTREDTKKAIFEYIELFYNRKRRHFCGSVK